MRVKNYGSMGKSNFYKNRTYRSKNEEHFIDFQITRRRYFILENFQPILLFTDVVSTSLYCMKYIKLAGKLYNDGINSNLY